MELRYPGAFPERFIPGMASELFSSKVSSEKSLECQGRGVRGDLGEPEVLGGLPAEQSQHKGVGAAPLSEPGIWGCSDVSLSRCQEWEPPNLGVLLVDSLKGRCPKICVGLVLGVPLLHKYVPQNLGWFCCGLAPHSGLGVPRGFCCGSALCSGVCVSQNSAQGMPLTQKWVPQNLGEFWCGSAPHSEVGVP